MPLLVIERQFAEQLHVTPESARLVTEINDDVGVHWLFSFLSADRKKTYWTLPSPSGERGWGVRESNVRHLSKLDRYAGRCTWTTFHRGHFSEYPAPHTAVVLELGTGRRS